MNNNNLLLEFENYLKIVKNLSKNTTIAYISDIRDFQNYLSISTVNTDNLPLGYVEYLKDQKKLKPATIRRRFISLKGYYAYLGNKMNLKDPFHDFRLHMKAEHRLPKTLMISEVKSLIDITNEQSRLASTEYGKYISTRDSAILDLLICTGMRAGEVASLSLTMLFTDDRSILIEGKGKRERILYVSSKNTWNKIIKWIKIRKKTNTVFNNVFLTKSKKPLSTHDIESIYKKYKELAKINPMSTPHYLRHTFATNLLSNGADIRSVQELLGHASVTTTEIYTEVSTFRKKQVLDKYNYRNYIKD